MTKKALESKKACSTFHCYINSWFCPELDQIFQRKGCKDWQTTQSRNKYLNCGFSRKSESTYVLCGFLGTKCHNHYCYIHVIVLQHLSRYL